MTFARGNPPGDECDLVGATVLARSSWVSLRPYRQGDFKHVLRGGYILLLLLSNFPFLDGSTADCLTQTATNLVAPKSSSSTPPSPSAFDSSSYPRLYPTSPEARHGPLHHHESKLRNRSSPAALAMLLLTDGVPCWMLPLLMQYEMKAREIELLLGDGRGRT